MGKIQTPLLIIHKPFDVYKDVKDYNPTKKRRVLIVFDDTVGDIKVNKDLKPIVAELFMRDIKVDILRVFISQSNFEESEDIRLNGTHYFIMKIPIKRQLQQTASNQSSDSKFKDLVKLYKNFTKEQFSCLVNNTTLSSDCT